MTFQQADLARAIGLRIEMRYLALDSFRSHLEGIKIRSDAGGRNPELILEAERGEITFLSDVPPVWFREALGL